MSNNWERIRLLQEEIKKIKETAHEVFRKEIKITFLEAEASLINGEGILKNLPFTWEVKLRIST